MMENELLDIMSKMDLLRSELDSLRPIADDRLNRLNQKLRLDWNYHSNSLEGNTLTESETKSLLLYGITANGKPLRDHIEMRGHNDALKKLESIVHHDIKVTETLIKDFHRMILVEMSDGESEINPGEYKTRPNYLYSVTGERIDFEPPQEVPDQMNRLVNWLNNHIDPPKRKRHQYDLHPLLIACGFHIRFVMIHPFGDGNGRMARILMNLILMLCGYVPAVVRQEKRKAYYTALDQSSLDTITPLALFVGQECIRSLELATRAAKGESIEDLSDIDKKLALLENELFPVENDQEIKTSLNRQVYDEILNGWAYDLLRELIQTVQKFNHLFIDNKHYSGVAGVSVNFDTRSAEEIVKEIKDKNLACTSELDEQNSMIWVSCNFGAFKKGGISNFGCHFEFRIDFSKYKYEVLVPKFTPEHIEMTRFCERLLHQPLTAGEIAEITVRVGNAIIEHIEYHTKKNGLR